MEESKQAGMGERMAELENMQILLEEARANARRIGGTEGYLLEARIDATLRETGKQMDDLRAPLARHQLQQY